MLPLFSVWIPSETLVLDSNKHRGGNNVRASCSLQANAAWGPNQRKLHGLCILEKRRGSASTSNKKSEISPVSPTPPAFRSSARCLPWTAVVLSSISRAQRVRWALDMLKCAGCCRGQRMRRLNSACTWCAVSRKRSKARLSFNQRKYAAGFQSTNNQLNI